MTNRNLLRGFFLGLCLIHCESGVNASGQLEEKEGDYFAKQRAAWETLSDEHRKKYHDTYRVRVRRHQEIVERVFENHFSKVIERDNENLGVKAVVSDEGIDVLEKFPVPGRNYTIFSGDCLEINRVRAVRYDVMLELLHVLSGIPKKISEENRVNCVRLPRIKEHIQSCYRLLTSLQELEGSYGKLKASGCKRDFWGKVYAPLKTLQGVKAPPSLTNRVKAKQMFEVLRRGVDIYCPVAQKVFLCRLSSMYGQPYLTEVEKEKLFSRLETWNQFRQKISRISYEPENFYQLWNENLSFGISHIVDPRAMVQDYLKREADQHNMYHTSLGERLYKKYFLLMFGEIGEVELLFLPDLPAEIRQIIGVYAGRSALSRLNAAYTLLALEHLPQALSSWTQKLRGDLRAYQHQMLESLDDIIKRLASGEFDFKNAKIYMDYYYAQLRYLEQMEDYMTSLSPRTVKE
jgi:hypothetical protein